MLSVKSKKDMASFPWHAKGKLNRGAISGMIASSNAKKKRVVPITLPKITMQKEDVPANNTGNIAGFSPIMSFRTFVQKRKKPHPSKRL